MVNAKPGNPVCTNVNQVTSPSAGYSEYTIILLDILFALHSGTENWS